MEPVLDESNQQEEAPKAKGKGVKLPKISLPKVKLPRLDLRWIGVAVFVAAVAVLNTVLVIRFSGPKLILKDPHMQPFAEEGDHEESGHSAALPHHVLAPSRITRFNLILDLPEVAPSSFIHRQAFVQGAVEIAKECFIGPQASIRGDIGQGIHLGEGCNVQDGAVIAALPTEERGEPRLDSLVQVGKRHWAVFLGDEVSLAPQSQVHGPSVVEDRVYLGMQALVFRSLIGKGSVLEPRSAAIGVRIPENRWVPAGTVVTTQAQADALPQVSEGYGYKTIAERTVKTHLELARSLQRH